MIAVLCYDVVQDSRRGRLQRRLKKHLVPVQKSVFEGSLSGRDLDRVIRLVKGTIDNETDTVRIYLLCDGCRVSTMYLGTAEVVPLLRGLVLV